VLAVNDFLSETFKNAEIEQLSENSIMAQYINVPKLKSDLQALKILVGGDADGGVGGVGDDPNNPVVPNDGDVEPNFGDEDVASDEMTQQGVDNMTDEYAPEDGQEEMPPEGQEGMPPEGQEGMPPDELGDDSEAALGGGAVGGEAEAVPGEGGDAASLVSDLEALIQSLGGPGGGLEGGNAAEEFQKGDPAPGDGMPPEEGGGEEVEGGEGEEEEMPPKKKKPFPPK
jgi:hypothetical protein